jgi:hypothetical protein
MSHTVSARAQNGFDHYVVQAVKGTFAHADSECTVEPTDDPSGTGTEVVMFTVSSYMFRAVMLMQYGRDPVTRGHFAALASASSEVPSDEVFNDAVMERGNLCCGAFNRDLAQFFPHTGMSTPCVLDHRSLGHIEALQPAYTRHYRATMGSGMCMHFTLVLCAFADLDFPFEPRVAEEAIDTAGELEMF